MTSSTDEQQKDKHATNQFFSSLARASRPPGHLARMAALRVWKNRRCGETNLEAHNTAGPHARSGISNEQAEQFPIGENSKGAFQMVKKFVCLTALGTALIAFVYQPASAQNSSGGGAPNYLGTPPKPAISDYGPFTKINFSKSNTKPLIAGRCGNPSGPCLFYGGDFVVDPFYPPSLANGLANETDLNVFGIPYGAAAWVPFTVPAGTGWAVTGLFTNNQSTYGVLDQYPTTPTSAAFWSVNQAVSPGNAGTVIASGTSAATSTPTGRAAFGLNEYTVQVTGLNFVLAPGKYWMAVVPLCTNTDDAYCHGVFFESDVEYINVRPANAQGPPEPVDESFFDSPFFGVSFTQTNSATGACGGIGCDAFSAGVLGRKIQ